MSLKEAYSKFFEKHSNVKIGLSTFCELHPVPVKFVCSYHKTVRSLLALKEHTSLAVDFRAFINQVTCDSSRKQCISSNCDDCKTH